MAHRLLIATGLAVVTILRVIGSVLYQPDDGERVSAWSIRKRDARIFFLLLSGLWIVAVAGLSVAQYAAEPPRVLQWATLPPHVGDGSAYAVIQRFGGIVVPLLVAALVLTPLIAANGRFLMLLARYIDEKILTPYINAYAERRARERLAEAASKASEPMVEAIARAAVEAAAKSAAEAIAQATIQAHAEATAHNNERWADWLARRDAALAQGREFNEPRPDEINGFQP